MILYITPTNRHLYKPQIKEMYALRYRVFKERLNWDVRTKNKLEIDEYDNEKAFYILYLDTNKKVRGCMRLLPTTGKYMIKNTFSVFRHSNPLYINPKVWEVSRFAVEDPKREAVKIGGISQITYELYASLFEFGFSNKITKYIFVASLGIEVLLKK